MENQSMKPAVHTVDDRTRHICAALGAVMSVRSYLEAGAASELRSGYRALQRAIDGDSIFPGNDDDDPEEEALHKLAELGALLNGVDMVRDHLFGRDMD
jgi:hypothetical protein